MKEPASQVYASGDQCGSAPGVGPDRAGDGHGDREQARDGVGEGYDDDRRQTVQRRCCPRARWLRRAGAVDAAVVEEGAGAVGGQAAVVGQDRGQSFQGRVGAGRPRLRLTLAAKATGRRLRARRGLGVARMARGRGHEAHGRFVGCVCVWGEMGLMSFCGLPYRLVVVLLAVLVLLLVLGSAESRARAADPGSVFELQDFTARALDAVGNDFTVAGGHPYEAVSSFSFPTTSVVLLQGSWLNRSSRPKSTFTELPPGFLANLAGVARCPLSKLATNPYFVECPAVDPGRHVASGHAREPGLPGWVV